jgi:hypothetical protein
MADADCGGAGGGEEGVLEFGWEDEQPTEIGGRRKKALQQQKRKNKPGTFGELSSPAKLQPLPHWPDTGLLGPR